MEIKIDNGWIQKMSYFQIHQFSIYHFEKIIKFIASKSGKIDSKGMDVAQPLWLSGCPEKGHGGAKMTIFKSTNSLFSFIFSIMGVRINLLHSVRVRFHFRLLRYYLQASPSNKATSLDQTLCMVTFALI